jgi:hypothetical protein
MISLIVSLSSLELYVSHAPVYLLLVVWVILVHLLLILTWLVLVYWWLVGLLVPPGWWGLRGVWFTLVVVPVRS